MQLTIDQNLNKVLEFQEKFNNSNGSDKLVYINTIINELNNLSNSLIQARSYVEMEFSNNKIEHKQK